MKPVTPLAPVAVAFPQPVRHLGARANQSVQKLLAKLESNVVEAQEEAAQARAKLQDAAKTGGPGTGQGREDHRRPGRRLRMPEGPWAGHPCLRRRPRSVTTWAELAQGWSTGVEALAKALGEPDARPSLLRGGDQPGVENN